MRGGTANADNHLWVTYVLNDSEVGKALTLCSSLKRVLTGRKVGVIVSQKVSNTWRECIHQAFDCFFVLEETRNVRGLKEDDFAKMFALTLKPFKKVVVLEPTMLVIKNCDTIFDDDEEGADISSQEFIMTRTEGMSVFMVNPSPSLFRHVMNNGIGNGTGIEKYWRTWIKNQSGSEEQRFLDEKKYNLSLASNGDFMNATIINMMNTPLEENTEEEKFGLLANMVLKYRNIIYEESVQPLLATSLTPTILSNEPFTPMLTRSKEPIAIVGMSCRYPSAHNLEDFWDLLINGRDGTGTAPGTRWNLSLLRGQNARCKMTNAGFLNYPVEDFDAKFFGISPKEVIFLDPQHRLLHEIVWEGLEDAAVNPQGLRGTNGGVFIGSWTNDYKDMLRGSGYTDFYRTYMGNSIGGAAARISFLLGMTGPSVATESGCSSAMVAVHMACKSLQTRETNFALACGVNLLLFPFDKDVLPMVISPEGKCKTFDAKADGFARAEGAGVLVLKRLSDAVRDGDKIWAMIRGSGMTQEGVSKSLGTPTVQCESLAMELALEDAGVEPEQVSYVEAHGTGTVVGDPMEIASIAKAYHSKNRKEPLIIGSVKTNVGHTESCSGITGIMKVVLAMQNEVIPPHINFETLNPSIDLDAVPAKIPVKPEVWKKENGKPRLAGVSSFGITGTDAHAIIEESPLIPSKFWNSGNSTTFQRPLHILKITAKTNEALEILVERYRAYLTTTEYEFKDLAFTSNIGRADFSHRAIIIAKSNEDAIKSIEENKIVRGEVSSNDSVGKVCFLFTGQGSQYPGMGKQLYETNPVFRMHFEYCEKILKNQYNIEIAKILWSEVNSNEVSRTIYSQTSIFCVEYALLKLWESWGVKPDYALGHSLGEFAAAVCAGILTVEDALKLVAERSRLIDQLPRGKMLVIKADKQRVDSFMNKFAGNDKNKMLDYAAINSAEQTVVAGDSEVVMHFANACKQANLKCMVLEATHAFHSNHMDPMLAEYKKIAETVKKQNGNGCVFISGMRGSIVESERVDANYWVEHTREKVWFIEASKKTVELGCKTFIEIGPQPVLSALTMMNNDQPLICLPSLKRNQNEWETLLNTVAKLYTTGLEINWNGFDMFYERKKVSIPHYPFIGKRFCPEALTKIGVASHPLLGSTQENALTLKLFKSALNTRGLEYVKDHAIGDNVIFPGAGYLEMCLAAGLATIEATRDTLATPSRPMKLENLFIEAPLRLHESQSVQLHTTAEFNRSTKENEGEWNDISIKICRLLPTSSSSKWVSHAKATFSPLITNQEKTTLGMNPTLFLETIEKESEDEHITQMYDKLASVGLKFGPSFRSIEKVWRELGDKKSSLLAKVKLPFDYQEQSNQYIVHPVVLDAMIQALMMLRPLSNLKKSLYVPIKIGKFVWLSGTTGSELYIQAFEENDSSLLIDSEGKVLAVMSSVELIETTVKAVESVLEQQSSLMPNLWEEVWKKAPTFLQRSGDTVAAAGKFYEQEFHSEFEQKYNSTSESLSQMFKNLETFIYLNFLRGLYEAGWKPKLNQQFKESVLFRELGIVSSLRHYFAFICDVLEAEGVLGRGEYVDSENYSDSEWTVIRMPPSNEELLQLLSSPEMSSDLIQRFQSTLLLQKVGESLSGLFSGSQSALSVLFPEGRKTYPSISDFYVEYLKQVQANQLEEIGVHLLDHIHSSQPNNTEAELRILEVGAGTGACSQKLIEMIGERQAQFEYTFTDISAAFFPAAEKKFEKNIKSLKFKKLNIEEDPISQGFPPNYYDFVLAGEVLHATRDVAESMRNIRVLLKPYGRLAVQETTRVSRVITFLFGTLEGYWRFQDFEIRKKYCVMEKSMWGQVMEANGLKVEGMFSVFDNYHSYMVAQKTADPIPLSIKNISSGKSKTWVVFHQEDHPISEYLLENIPQVWGRRVVTIKSGTKFGLQDGGGKGGSYFMVRKREYEDYEALFKNLVGEKELELEGIVYCWSLDKSTFSSSSSSQDEILMPFFNLSKSLLQLNLKKNPRLALVTNGVVPLDDNDMSSFSASTLWGYTKSMKNENFNFNCKAIEVIDKIENVSRCQEVFHELWSSEKDVQVAFSGSNRCVPKFTPHKALVDPLKLPSGTDRFQLILPESRSISDLQFGHLDMMNVGEEEVEVQIKASALNFRDVLSVIKPSEEFKDSNTVGFDFAGVVKQVGIKVSKWKVGDRVFGCNIHFTALPSHVTLSQDLLLELPDTLSFCEGATMPAVYITSVLCLMEVAKIKKGDVVLIHTASGGVGLSAIEICKYFGCTIIATAGSKRKQNYLRSLGIQHIFHSRNTKYGDQILELTNGRGVDVVLNSLTSEGFKEATLKACANGARFVEMSVLNIWSKEEVKQLRPDVSYTAIDLSKSGQKEWIRLLETLKSFSDGMIMRPIPYLRFYALNIREALHYMQKAKHIGKIVCAMPELRNEGGEVKPFTPMFNETSTYLITGGLGGIGFTICQWMTGKGAKHIILANRSSPNDSIQKKIRELNSNGANVTSVQLDVANYEQCKELIQNQISKMKMPPLKGVMHAAGTLLDGLITSQDWPKFSSTLNTKIYGTLNLHELTKGLNLEHFVTFSSIAALFGSPGQSNHSAGNCFEDAFTHYRYSIGLPGTSINWGQWGEVGVAQEVEIPGMKAMSSVQGLSCIEYALNRHLVQLCAVNMESFRVMSMLYPQMAIYLDERIWNSSRSPAAKGIKSDEFWRQYDSLPEPDEKLDLMRAQLQFIIRTTLKLDDMDVINNDANLQEMGVDSLMFVEIKNCVQIMLGDRLQVNANSLKDCTTVNLIASTLVKLIEGDAELEMGVPTTEQVAELIREDAVLPEHISPKPGQEAAVDIQDVKMVLLAGATGVLGSYVLKELSLSSQITKVVCILRATNAEKGEERLRKVLMGKNLLSKVDMKKVQCVRGDVALPKLGMDDKTWEELSGTVEAVVNCSARVDHTEQYRKRTSTSDIRAVNIGGTKNLLQFACENKLKHFGQASSLIAVLKTDEQNQVSEEWPEVGDFDGVTSYAYPISKFVGDVLVKEALSRGLPSKVFRLPLLSGELETGQCAPETNHALLRYMFILKKGLMPSLPGPLLMLPVDFSAKATVQLFLDKRAPPDMYIAGVAHPDVDQQFVEIAAKLGYPVNVVELSEFLTVVKDSQNQKGEPQEQSSSAFHLFSEVYSDEESIVAGYTNTPTLQRWIEGNPDVYKSRKLAKFNPAFYDEQQPTMNYILKDLMYLKSQGWFEKFGL